MGRTVFGEYFTQNYSHFSELMIHSLLSYNESNTLDSFSQLQNAGQGTGNLCDTIHRTLFTLFEQKYNNPSADINTLAEEIHVSCRWLYEQTVRLTGKTPSEYLKCLRMHAACPLLQSGKPLVEVSKSVGYAHTKTFYSSPLVLIQNTL